MTVLYDMFLNEMNVFEYVLHPKKLWVDGHNPFLMEIMLPYNPIVCIVVVLDQVGWRVRSLQLDPPNIHYLVHNFHERNSTLHTIILKTNLYITCCTKMISPPHEMDLFQCVVHPKNYKSIDVIPSP